MLRYLACFCVILFCSKFSYCQSIGDLKKSLTPPGLPKLPNLPSSKDIFDKGKEELEKRFPKISIKDNGQVIRMPLPNGLSTSETPLENFDVLIYYHEGFKGPVLALNVGNEIKDLSQFKLMFEGNPTDYDKKLSSCKLKDGVKLNLYEVKDFNNPNYLITTPTMKFSEIQGNWNDKAS